MEKNVFMGTSPATATIASLSLPKGGGAIASMGMTPGNVGADGTASFSIPLPISAGRPGSTLTPPVAISYNSGAGNGVFGLGWQLPVMRISRRTRYGVPLFDESADDEADQYLGPDGEVLVPQCDEEGSVIIESRTTFRELEFEQAYQVCRYDPRVEGSFSRIERWWRDGESASTFWLIQDATGHLHCLGKTIAGRVASPQGLTDTRNPRVGEWLLEESVSPTGEHMIYCYQNEDNTGVSPDKQYPLGTLPHLTEIRYGNLQPAANLYLWSSDDIHAATPSVQWLFKLIFDYGARSMDPHTQSQDEIGPDQHWTARHDPFSRFDYGYEVRCHRLCRQIIMFHQNFTELNQGDATVVGRLVLDYDENAVLSRLIGARLWAYDTDGQPQSQPPLFLNYTSFDTSPRPDAWRASQGLPSVDDGNSFQMVDLFGDGLPGQLYKSSNGWLYREPQRAALSASDEDAVSYGSWQTLPQLPSMTKVRTMLMDTDGNGRLDLVVTQPGMAGFFTLNPDKSWSSFVPFSALPTEFFHPRMLLADLTGAGLSDLVLIGPNSVRLFSKKRRGSRDGWVSSVEVDRDQHEQCNDLPVIGQDERSLIAFSDPFGTGTQHLLQISYDGVYCWPNLGRGRFGEKRAIPLAKEDAVTGFASAEQFNPQQIYLADLDGSGAVDVIYVRSTAIDIYFNQTGNGFSKKVELIMPTGVNFDRHCQLSLADFDGKGVTSLMLTVLHPDISHWRYDFCKQKPYLLCEIDNNMGAHTRLYYRSSAQYWLDDKKLKGATASRLPFPIQTLARVESKDEINQCKQTHHYAYHYGVYDGTEREFRGFRLVEMFDGSITAPALSFKDTPITHTRTWYHTGMTGDEISLPGEPWEGDLEAPESLPTLLTQWQGTENDGKDQLMTNADPEGRRWLNRALNRKVLRQEVYGQDGSAQQNKPYSISTTRYQVRLLKAGNEKSPSLVLPLVLEQMSFNYERIVTDPQIRQTVQLVSNYYGQPTQSVDICYPRRSSANWDEYTEAFPDILPDSLKDSSRTSEQDVLHVLLNQQRYQQLTDNAYWQLGIPTQSRRDKLCLTNRFSPNYLSYEVLTGIQGLLDGQSKRTYLGQQEVFYKESKPTKLPVLVDHIEIAQLDVVQMTLLAQRMGIDFNDIVIRSGLEARKIILEPKKADGVYVASSGFSTYDPSCFYQVVALQSNRLSGLTHISYNAYGLPVSITDPIGNTSKVKKYDYRFMTPSQIEDINANVHCVAQDAFGRVIADWYYGTENEVIVGFPAPAPSDYCVASVEQLIAKATLPTTQRKPMTVASRQAFDLFSWMGELCTDTIIKVVGQQVLNLLLKHGFILPGHDAKNMLLTARIRRWAADKADLPGLDQNAADELCLLIDSTPRHPPHSVVISADRYPALNYYNDQRPQQIAAVVYYGNSSGQTLQTITLHEIGLKCLRPLAGERSIKETVLKLETVTDDCFERWVVSGHIDLDGKGQIIRSYQPHFVNDWRYVIHKQRQATDYADTNFYDALGRQILVVTALGYSRRTSYTPWFIVDEDENDMTLKP